MLNAPIVCITNNPYTMVQYNFGMSKLTSLNENHSADEKNWVSAAKWNICMGVSKPVKYNWYDCYMAWDFNQDPKTLLYSV